MNLWADFAVISLQLSSTITAIFLLKGTFCFLKGTILVPRIVVPRIELVPGFGLPPSPRHLSHPPHIHTRAVMDRSRYPYHFYEMQHTEAHCIATHTATRTATQVPIPYLRLVVLGDWSAVFDHVGQRWRYVSLF